MQKIITFILALALYAPNIASLLAYSECELVAILNKKPDCDCQLTTTHQQDNTANLPHKHKLDIQEPDWKYIAPVSFQQANRYGVIVGDAFQQYESPYHPLLAGDDIFRPPCC